MYSPNIQQAHLEAIEMIGLIEEGVIEPNRNEELALRNLPLVNYFATEALARALELGIEVEKDELFSTGMYGLAKAIGTYEPEKGKFSTYASTCIKNELRELIRKAVVHKKHSACEFPLHTATNERPVEAIVERNALLERVLRILDTISPDQKEALIKSVLGFSREEIGPSKAAASARAIRARNHLRKRLGIVEAENAAIHTPIEG